MKVIKHLRHETPEHKLKSFFKQMPLISRLLISTVIITTMILAILRSPTQFSFYSFVDVRPISQMILFLVVMVTDFQKQERKGSFFFIFSYVIKICLIAALKILVNLLISNISEIKDLFSQTSYPFLFCFCVAFRDMIKKPQQQRYFLIAPFKIKYLFYPIFLAFLLSLFGLRIDILLTFLVALLLILIRFDNILSWLCKKIDNKILTPGAISAGMLATGCTEIQMSQIDRVVTNHSIVLQENN